MESALTQELVGTVTGIVTMAAACGVAGIVVIYKLIF